LKWEEKRGRRKDLAWLWVEEEEDEGQTILSREGETFSISTAEKHQTSLSPRDSLKKRSFERRGLTLQDEEGGYRVRRGQEERMLGLNIEEKRKGNDVITTYFFLTMNGSMADWTKTPTKTASKDFNLLIGDRTKK